MTMIEVVVWAGLLGVFAYMGLGFFSTSEDLSRAASAKSLNMEAFRILQMRMEEQIRNRIQYDLSLLHPALKNLNTNYESLFSVPSGGLRKNLLRSNAMVLKDSGNPVYEQFYAVTKCVEKPDSWTTEHSNFVNQSNPCGFECPGIPMIYYYQGMVNNPVQNPNKVSWRSFPAKDGSIFRQTAAAGFCVSRQHKMESTPSGRSRTVEDQVRVTYYSYVFDVGRKLRMLVHTSIVAEDSNPRGRVFSKSTR
jgi:type II secretory pathway pseudopilin PulG